MESYRAFYHSNDRNRRNHGGGSDISISENNSSIIGSGATLNHNAGGECSGNGGHDFSMSGNNTSACDGGVTLNQNAGSECGEDGGTVIQGHLINKLKCVLTNLKVRKKQSTFLFYCSLKTRSNNCPHKTRQTLFLTC